MNLLHKKQNDLCAFGWRTCVLNLFLFTDKNILLKCTISCFGQKASDKHEKNNFWFCHNNNIVLVVTVIVK